MIGRGGARDQTLMLLAVCLLAKEGAVRQGMPAEAGKLQVLDRSS